MKTKLNSNTVQVDLAVVGGGLGGCTMVWQAYRRGLRVAMIDHLNPTSSSRVAAGLVTPITGGRLALSWRYPEFFTAAMELYRFAEAQSNAAFWSVAPALRIFSSEDEKALFESRWAKPEYLQEGNSIFVEPLSPQHLSSDGLTRYSAPHGGFLMSPAARLDTEPFLQATRNMLTQKGMLFDRLLDLDKEMLPEAERFVFPNLNLYANQVCLAQGTLARSNRWFGSLALHPARGDILQVVACAPWIEHIVHHNAWIVPLASNNFLLGATYTRQGQGGEIDTSVGIAAREELLSRWKEFFYPTVPEVQVIGQRAAVRPASYDRHPLIGSHHEHPNLLCMNGLGSKGSLLAPKLAELLLNHSIHSESIEPALRWDRKKG